MFIINEWDKNNTKNYLNPKFIRNNYTLMIG